MNHPDDTIAAISTPPGQGGIGIVRLSGPDSIRIAETVFQPKQRDSRISSSPRRILYGHILDPEGSVMDEVLLTAMPAPNSYTREDVVEISCHGGFISARKILERALEIGARLAEPGEFTKRAFLNGRLNLTQAEAVLDIINAKTEEGMKMACEQLGGGLSERLEAIRGMLVDLAAELEAYIDFPEDEIETSSKDAIRSKLLSAGAETVKLSKTFDEARFFRDGLSVAIIGRPNVGKSSLLNILLQKDRAIVTDVPGTTRDLIEDFIDIKGLPVRIIDTAGIRSSEEHVEKEGIRRSLQAIERADFIIAMFDGSEPLRGEDFEIMKMVNNRNAVYVISKSDLPSRVSREEIADGKGRCIKISAKTGNGIEELKSVIFESNIHGSRGESEGVVVTNIRHKNALDRATGALEKAALLFESDTPLEIVSIELRAAIASIGEITGAVTDDEILQKIFNSFCIGK